MLIQDGPDWFKNEEFWKIYKPLMFDPDRMADTGLEVEGIIRLAGLQPGNRVLDLCCGEARLSIEFAKRGYAVTGVDITDAYLDEAKRNILKQQLDVCLVKDDVRKFTGSGAFDFAMNYFTSFGYFEDPDDDLAFCRNACDSLKKGGKFLIDTIGKETVAMNFKESEWFTRGGYHIMLEYKVTDGWTHIINRWLFISEDPSKPSELQETVFRHRLYSAVEMAELLDRAGFSEIQFFGALDGRPYDHTAERMLALAVK